MPTTPRARRPRAKGSPNGAAAQPDRQKLAQIDMLGTRQRASQVYGMLSALQQNRAQLEQLQLLNGLDDGHQVPQQGAGTFAQEYAQLDARAEHIADRYKHLEGMVEQIAAEQLDQQERAIRLAAEESDRLDALTPEERAAERERQAEREHAAAQAAASR